MAAGVFAAGALAAGTLAAGALAAATLAGAALVVAALAGVLFTTGFLTPASEVTFLTAGFEAAFEAVDFSGTTDLLFEADFIESLTD